MAARNWLRTWFLPVVFAGLILTLALMSEQGFHTHPPHTTASANEMDSIPYHENASSTEQGRSPGSLSISEL